MPLRSKRDYPELDKLSVRLARRKYFSVSYPKSGRTWLRFMVDDYRTRLFGIRVPQVFAVEKKLRWRHRIVWTHAGGDFRHPYYGQLTFRDRLDRAAPYLFLTRNFHGILNSAFHHRTYRRNKMQLPPSEFIRHPNCGILHVVSYYNMWLELRREIPSFKVFAYEDLKKDPFTTMSGVVEALELPLREDLLRQTVECGSVANMKVLANSDAYAGTVLAPSDRGDERSAKVREGSTSGYRSLFSDEDLAYFGQVISNHFLGLEDPDFAGCAERIDLKA